MCGREVIFILQVVTVREPTDEEAAAGGPIEDTPTTINMFFDSVNFRLCKIYFHNDIKVILVNFLNIWHIQYQKLDL
jgi:hypothetical protein